MTTGILTRSTALSLHPQLRIQRASTKTSISDTTNSENPVSNNESSEVGSQQASEKKKTQAELDDEAMSGDGGTAGLELEDGQPVSMKRSVKNNMFRYI